MASLPPVSPGSVLTESAGNGSAAYDIEADLAAQMDRGEFPQEGYASAAVLPEENGAYPLGEEYGDEGDDEDEGGWWGEHPETTFDPSVYTAHQDFQRAASRYVSPMGYDGPSPSDVVGDYRPAATYNVSGESALGFEGESAMAAFMRQSGTGVSAMGYDEVSSSVGPVASAYPPGPLSSGAPDQVDMHAVSYPHLTLPAIHTA